MKWEKIQTELFLCVIGCQIAEKIHQQNVEVKNANGKETSTDKTSNGTKGQQEKRRMVKKVIYLFMHALLTFFTLVVFSSRRFLLIDVLSMLAFFTFDIISNRLFFYFSTFCPSRHCYMLRFFQSTFFTFLRFVPVNVSYISSMFCPSRLFFRSTF
jgi:hypothetical protein